MFYRLTAAVMVLTGMALAEIPSGYVSYWKFDDDLADEAGINDGVMSSGDAVYAGGVNGSAIKLSSSGAYVNLGTGASLDFTGSFSIGGWVLATGTAGYQKLVDKSTWNSGFYIQQGSTWPGRWEFKFQSKEYAREATPVSDQIDSWVHLMAVYDGSIMYLYSDGVLVDTTGSAGMTQSTTSLKFGAVNAVLDEMIMYTRALDSTEVQGLMSATRDTTPPAFSHISAEVLPAFEAEITFATDQAAYCDVEFYADGVGPFTYSSYDAETDHVMMINGLSASTEWYYRLHAVNQQGYASVSGWDTITVVPAQPDQKFSLAYANPPRKTVSQNLVWPAAVGDADVCLYPDDKLAAISITIDDNQANNHPWWRNWGQVYDQRYTWFINCSSIDVITQANAGTWDGWREMYAEGHAVQSHGYTHSNSMRTYGMCRVAVEEEIPGNRCITHAYASGGSTEDRDTAALVFQASRGVNLGINTAGRINYRDIRWTMPDDAMATIDGILAPGSASRRGWIGGLKHHYLNTADTAYTASVLAYMYARHDSLLVATYPDIIRYSQSFDTHDLNVTDVTDSMISFALTDSMLDTLFNYPLTVKVRIDNSWDTCIAVQGQNPVDVSVVEHEGNKYALVKAVPDRGEVLLSLVDIDIVSTPVISPAGGVVACSVQVGITCIDATADIYFTIDGTDPDSTATLYTGPFVLKDDATVKTRAYNGVDMPSRIATASFAVATQVADVVISPDGGSHDNTVTVSLDCATAGAAIHYTTDGSDPDESSAAYSVPFELTTDAVVKAVAYQGCLEVSTVSQASFTINSVIVPDTSITVTVDNLDAATVGTWTSSTHMSDYYGADYSHDGNEGHGTKSITFTPDLPRAGAYKVYLRWNDGATRADNVPVLIAHAAGTETLAVDMTTQGAQWILQGRYVFDAGTAGALTLTNTGTNGYVIADAARWVYDDTLTSVANPLPAAAVSGKVPALSVLSDGSVLYGTPVDGTVRLGITDLAGRSLFTEVVVQQTAGIHRIPCPDAMTRTGVYIFQLWTPAGTKAVRQLILK